MRLAYDARGNLIERIEPDGGRTKYEYTPRNWVKTTTVQGDDCVKYSSQFPIGTPLD
ncbi:MAG: RHS repeat protein [Peptococcaceae bacterium]|nr:RHS repeat protein [Peptococcaceae bacterium]